MIRVVLFALSVGAAGCMVGTEGAPRVLFGTESLDGGATCPAGGRLVTAGVDTNANGILEASETSSSFPLCDTHLQSGEVAVDYSSAGWTLAEGTGERTFTRPVPFPTEFAKVPSVMISLRGVDDSTPRDRVEVRVSGVDTKGFVLFVRTWQDSLVNGVTVSWLAYVP